MFGKNFNVDIVYLWVNGKDKQLQDQKDEIVKSSTCKINQDFGAYDNARYAENEELRYSLRSVMKNIPWINNIFIITNGQAPEWLDINHPKIKLIKHEQIMPADSLPTFNSCAIEACIGNIPELSEHFLLANDDCFVNKPLSKNFFFTRKGYPISRFTRYENLKEYKGSSLYKQSIYYSLELINKKFNTRFKDILPHHNIDAYLKSDFLECSEEFKTEFNDVIHSKFRNDGVQRIICSLYSLAKKRAKIKMVSGERTLKPQDSFYMLINSLSNMYKNIYINEPALYCLNDEPAVLQEHRDNLKYFLNGEFSSVQDWEIKADLELIQTATEMRNEYFKKNKKIIQDKILENFKKNIFSLYYYIIRKDLNLVLCIFGHKKCFKILNENNVQKRYDKLLSKLRKKYKKEKIKVVFIVRENQKWSYQSLYDLLASDENFEPLILVSLLVSVHDGKDTTRNNLEENYNFFKSRGMNVDYLYENNKPKDLKQFNPDIVFYDQSWDLFKKHSPYYVSEYALTCYCSYSYETLYDKDNYTHTFHGLLYKYFIEHELNMIRYAVCSNRARENCVITGYPKLDVYLDEKCTNGKHFFKEPEKYKIIYAPHHSFDNVLQLSTFLENGKFILDLAKKHPETTWLFKPHPRLKFALQKSGYMTEEEIEEYFNEWEKIGSVYTEGDYFGAFEESDLMITDCLSFLAEYLPTTKPLIRLINKNSLPLNRLGERVVSEYYTASDNQELVNLLDEIVYKNNDLKKERRKALALKLFDKETKASEKIFQHIDNVLSNKSQKKPSYKIYEFFYTLLDRESLCMYILIRISRLLTCFMFDKEEKRKKQNKLITKMRTNLYGWNVKANAVSIGKNFWCGGFSSVNRRTVLKDYVNFNGMRIMGNGNVIIGNYFHSGVEVLIITQNHNYDKGNAIPYDTTYIYKDVIIEDFVWVGSRVTILPGTKIGEGAVIQGGSVVHGEIPPYAVAGGNPAKVFKYRDIEHFKKLKEEGKFN